MQHLVKLTTHSGVNCFYALLNSVCTAHHRGISFEPVSEQLIHSVSGLNAGISKVWSTVRLRVLWPVCSGVRVCRMGVATPLLLLLLLLLLSHNNLLLLPPAPSSHASYTLSSGDNYDAVIKINMI